MTQRNRN